MTTIYLIRHAEAEGNLYRRIHGWYDALITDNGSAQIDALQRRFQDIHIDAVWSSDLYRTKTTARAVYVPKGLELHTDPGLREVHMGDWEDKPWGEVYHFDGDRIALFNRSDPSWQAPNGESLDQVGQRVHDTLCRIAIGYPDKTIAVFSHGTAIRQLLAMVKDVAPQDWHKMSHSENTAVTRLFYDRGRLTLDPDLELDASHLPENIRTMARQNWWRKDRSVQDVNLWYRPLDWEKEKETIYLAAREEAWRTTHGTELAFDGEGFLCDAKEHLSRSPWGVTVAMSGDEFAGLLQLDTQRYQELNAGYIPFCYIAPSRREQNLGVQLIGQAVSFFRPLGRDKLRLRCAPYNDHAQHFYQKYGFVKVGEEQGSRVPLDIMEKYIGYDR